MLIFFEASLLVSQSNALILQNLNLAKPLFSKINEYLINSRRQEIVTTPSPSSFYFTVKEIGSDNFRYQ